MTEKHYIACDLGAESGRVILGTLAGGKVELDEVHRFPNGAIKVQGSLRWDLLRIFDELKRGLRKVADKAVAVESVSVDSWGVDYVLSNDRQPFLAPAYQYRDARTEGTFHTVSERIGRETIFAETGIQFMSINTIYQLATELETNPDLLGIADRFLTVADHINYLFCGVPCIERSLASTTQLFNPIAGDWSRELISQLGLPEKVFPRIVESATRLGFLSKDIQADTGLPSIEVVASCSHDTAAAVAAVPAEGENWAFLSSGTWSLFGVELPQPLINDQAREHNFSNESGYGGTTRFQISLIGLWLLQECRRMWAIEGQQLDYAEINRLAQQAEPLRSVIDPNDPRFLSPENMLTAVADFCSETGQPIPETVGQVARCILESLALLYAQTLSGLEQVTGRTITQLHIVGGGSQSSLLNQFAADATGRTVLAGPVEATATGNVLVQAIAMGDVASLSELRSIVRESSSIESFVPQSSQAWKDARHRIASLS